MIFSVEASQKLLSVSRIPSKYIIVAILGSGLLTVAVVEGVAMLLHEHGQAV